MTAAKDDSGKGIDYLWSCMLGYAFGGRPGLHPPKHARTLL